MITIAEFEVTKDHKTLWVNTTHCISRICPFSFEIFRGRYGEESINHVHKGGIQPPDWELFKQKMKEVFGIEITEEPPEQLFTWLKNTKV
jgi:hypothetical protein